MTTQELDFSSGLPDALVLYPSESGSSISFSHFTVIYQTAYKNAYADILSKRIFSFEFNNLKFSPVLKEKNIDNLRFYRTLDNIEAVIYKYHELINRNEIIRSQPLNKHFIVNETNALLYSIRRTSELILSLITNRTDYSIGMFLNDLKNNNKIFNNFKFEFSDIIFLHMTNLVTNASKHSLIYEDTYFNIFPTFERFFAVKKLSKQQFSDKYNPSTKNPYFFWEQDNINKSKETIDFIEINNTDIIIEYNICIHQAIISFLKLSDKYITYFKKFKIKENINKP